MVLPRVTDDIAAEHGDALLALFVDLQHAGIDLDGVVRFRLEAGEEIGGALGAGGSAGRGNGERRSGKDRSGAKDFIAAPRAWASSPAASR